MPNDSDRLTPAQRRAYDQVEDLCRRASVHITRLKLAGVPMSDDEARMNHLMQACEGIKHHDEMLGKTEGN